MFRLILSGWRQEDEETTQEFRGAGNGGPPSTALGGEGAGVRGVRRGGRPAGPVLPIFENGAAAFERNGKPQADKAQERITALDARATITLRAGISTFTCCIQSPLIVRREVIA